MAMPLHKHILVEITLPITSYFIAAW